MRASTPQHRSDRSKDLSEFIVQFTRNIAQRRFLSGNQFLRQFTASRGNLGQTSEQTPVPANHGKAVQQDGQQGRGQKNIHLPLHAVINLHDSLTRLLLVLAILHQQSGHRCAESGLPLLQRQLDLLARFFFLSITSQRENAVRRIPELIQIFSQKGALLGSSAGCGKLRFEAHGIVQVGADPLELRGPGRQRIRLVAAYHVAHGHGEQVEVILNSQQLKRILSVAVH